MDLDSLPDETLIEASGMYLNASGGFHKCWARPIPEMISGYGVRMWEVLVYGSRMSESLTDAAHITEWRVLYCDQAVSS